MTALDRAYDTPELQFHPPEPPRMLIVARLGTLIALCGAAVLVGWGLNIGLLKSLSPDMISMKANTAVGFVAVGLALMLWALPARRFARRLSALCAAAAALLGSATLAEYLFHINLGIDQRLFLEPAGASGALAPGRMAAFSALSFLLLGGGLLLSLRRRAIALSQALALLTVTLGLLSFFGYAYGADSNFGLGFYMHMALHTSLLFILAGVTMLHLHLDEGLLRTLTPESVGGWLLRRLLPCAAGVPLLLGWLHRMGDRLGLHDDPTGDALLMVCFMLLAVLMSWWAARAMTRMDLIRQKTETDLRAAIAHQHESEMQFLAVLYASQDAIQLLEGGRFIDCNQAAVELLGFKHKSELVNRGPADISPPFQPDGQPSADKAVQMIALAMRHGFHRFEWTCRRAIGQEFQAEIHVTAMVVGGRTQLHCVVRDMTQRHIQEQRLQQLSQAVEQTHAAVVIADTRARIEYVNPAFTKLTGYSLDEIKGRNPRVLQSGQTPRATYESMWSQLHAGRTWSGEFLNRSKQGELFWELAIISPLRDAQGRTTHFVAVKENITPRKALDLELQDSRVKLARAMKLAHLTNWEYDVATDRYTFDDRFYAAFATTAQREGGHSMSFGDFVRNFVHPQDAQLVVRAVQHALQNTQPIVEDQFEYRVIRRDGAVRHVLTRYVASRGPDGKLGSFHGANQDITDIKEATEALRAKTALFEAQVNSTIDGILVVDSNNKRIITNRRMGELFNVPFALDRDVDDAALLQHVLSLMKDPDAFLKKVQHLNNRPQESSRDELELKDGRIIDRYSAPVLGNDGLYYGRIWTFRDITPQKSMESKLRIAATIDTLTGLPNRALLSDRLQQAVLRSQRSPEYHFAVLFLDMDRFKLINDSLGHDIGDLMLQEIARRLKTVVRIGDSLTRTASHTTARLGGDEFVILLDSISSPEDATVVAGRLLEVLAQPYRLRDNDIYSTASIGIVTSDLAAENAEQILRDADTAMYEAKLAGKGRYALFGTPMRQRVQTRLNIETDLRKAIDGDQFFLVFEPIVSLQSGHVQRFEALIRWQHPDRGLIMPGEFIAIAEETGLILPMGEWVLRQACSQFVRWRRELGDQAPASISVNLSRTQLLLSDLPERVANILQETAMPADCLHLEVTESAVMRDVAGAVRTLHAIKQMGVKLDIDDFGTGYSSLACLHEFPMDVLKIDRSFIANIERGRDFAALVNAVTQLARNLGIQVVAEGIETIDQALILQSLDCEFGQGYYFSRPMSADAAGKFRAEHKIGNLRATSPLPIET